jgi:hypothetical protein
MLAAKDRAQVLLSLYQPGSKQFKDESVDKLRWYNFKLAAGDLESIK